MMLTESHSNFTPYVSSLRSRPKFIKNKLSPGVSKQIFCHVIFQKKAAVDLLHQLTSLSWDILNFVFLALWFSEFRFLLSVFVIDK